MSGAQEFGGVWDDIAEAVKWKPILPLLKAAREAPAGPAKLVAVRDVVAFFLRTAQGGDPYQRPAFRAFALFVELANTDPRVRQLADQLMGPPA
jgi:hypothetical protein